MLTGSAAPRDQARASTPRHDAARSRGAEGGVVLAPALLAGVLCAIGLTARSLSLDEAASATIALQHGHALSAAIAHDGGNMAGYYAFLHVWTGAVGHGVLALRAPSVLAAALTAGLSADLGRRLLDARAGLVAGLLTAVSLPLVFWGQSARAYAPLVLLVTASFAALLAWVRAPDDGRRRRALLAYALCIALAGYAGLLAWLVVPGQLAWVAWRRAPVRAPLLALAGALAADAPLIVWAAHRGGGQLAWVSPPDLHTALQTVEMLASAALPPNFPTALTAVPLLLLTVGLSGFGLMRRLRPPTETSGPARAAAGLLAAWLVLPCALVLAASLLAQPLLVPRNLLLCVPAVSLLIVIGLRCLPGHCAVRWLTLTGLLALRAWPLLGAAGISPEDWRAATAHVLGARSRAPTCVAFYPQDARMPFRLYLPPRGLGPPRSVLPAVGWREGRPYVEAYDTLPRSAVARLPALCREVWLVAGHVGRPDGPPRSRADFHRFEALRAALTAVFGPPRGSRFGYAPAVTVARFTYGRSVGPTNVKALRPRSRTPLRTTSTT